MTAQNEPCLKCRRTAQELVRLIDELCSSIRNSVGNPDATTLTILAFSNLPKRARAGFAADVEHAFDVVHDDHDGRLELLADLGDLLKYPSGHTDCDHMRSSRSGTR